MYYLGTQSGNHRHHIDVPITYDLSLRHIMGAISRLSLIDILYRYINI